MIRPLFTLATAFAVTLPAVAQTPSPAPALAPGEIVAAAPVSDWMRIAPSDLLVMNLAPDAKEPGAKSRRVVIQLMPPPFSQGWISNIRKLAAARWWDGLSINRVQDNYVVQWGDADGEDKAKAKALPGDLAAIDETGYLTDVRASDGLVELIGKSLPYLTTEYLVYQKMTKFSPVRLDTYALTAFNWRGWPTAFAEGNVWPVHCYGMVGVGRDMPPNTGTGAELYVVIGHAPRHLDRNIALVGRVISGIEHLSSLPRGAGALGFYETPEERTGIVSVRIGNEVTGLPGYEYLSTESETFARYADARANRRDAFFIKPAGGADVCNIPVPVRRVASK